jgi:large subunit ribosomal protein L19
VPGRSSGGRTSWTGSGPVVCDPLGRELGRELGGSNMLYSAAGRTRSAALPDPSGSSSLPMRETRNERPVNVLDEIVSDQLRTDLPELASGDTVKVSAKVVEGNRERIQVFEGIVMRLRGGGITRSITVRRIASGVGVERTFKIHSPRIEKIEVVRHGQVRRAQLYFLRKRVGKAATLRERRTNR